MMDVVWRESRDWVKSRLTLPHIRSGLRGAGALITCLFVIWNTPTWLITASKHSPLLGFNLMILIIIFLVKVWKRYGGDINMTAFRLVLEVMNQAKVIRDEYLQVPAAPNQGDIPIIARRKINRKVVRIMVFFALVQLCLVPEEHLTCVNAILALKFLNDAYKFFFKDNEEESRNPSRLFFSQRLAYLMQLLKGVMALNILFYQFFYVSKAYFIVTMLYYVLLQRYLERPITVLLELLQLDAFEGMEQYYVSTLLCALEITLCLVFSLWTLLDNKQLLMLIAIYTNIYSSGREFIQDNVTCAFGEWASLAQFEKASDQEVKQYDDVCAICLCAMKVARKTPCKHLFHGHCLRRCLKEKPNCPLCSASLKM